MSSRGKTKKDIFSSENVDQNTSFPTPSRNKHTQLSFTTQKLPLCYTFVTHNLVQLQMNIKYVTTKTTTFFLYVLTNRQKRCLI